MKNTPKAEKQRPKPLSQGTFPKKNACREAGAVAKADIAATNPKAQFQPCPE